MADVKIAKSWVEVSPESHFSLQNLPYGVFKPSAEAAPRVGVAIGEQVLDLSVLAKAGLFAGANMDGGKCFSEGALNAFMDLGRAAWTEARTTISNLLNADTATLRDNAELRKTALVPQSQVTMLLPAKVGDYTDFYSSRYHATNVGVMFRGPENALKPNWLHLPVGYHGRASSVVVSGTDLHRPRGQLKAPDAPPRHDVSNRMDFELEMGCFVGKANKLGHPVSMKDAKDHLFGLVVMNDWSARDIQKWEYIPLGPFGGKNFGTTISPWVVTFDALAPFAKANQEQVEPSPLPYLQAAPDKKLECYDIKLEVSIQGKGMKEPKQVSVSNASYLYWNFEQQLVHHSVTGCNMQPGDLLGSGTISGPEPHEYGSMLELSWNMKNKIDMGDGTTRCFLNDGDEVNMVGYCQGDGYRVGFGDCKGRVLPPVEL